MPAKCCVPNCRGNYDAGEKMSVFKFPKDAEKRKLWLNKIPRADFSPTDHSVVCAQHFSPQFIVTIDRITRPDGSVLTVERERPKLSDDAYPSIFPNCPFYLSDEPPIKRKKPEQRQQEVEHRDQAFLTNWLEADIIVNFDEFSLKCTAHLGEDLWFYNEHSTKQYWSFYKIVDADAPNTTSRPILRSTIRVFADMHVEVFTDSPARLPDSSLKWFFPQGSPVLTNWSQFDTLLSHFSGHSVQDLDIKDHVQIFIEGLKDLCSDDRMEEISDDMCSIKERMVFLVEQMKLLFCPVKRYSSETLLWSFQILSRAPRTYAALRNTFLTLPHTSYLKRLSSAFSIEGGLKDPNSRNIHEEYLKQKCNNIKEKERTVILMLDEIHVSEQLSYKHGKLEGSASNLSVRGASTAQVFMISSVRSKNKDVVAIVPVKNLNAKTLHEMLMKVLETLHKCGYVVLCVISDNNRVNRNAFTVVCGGELKVSIQNPFKLSEKLFFLFDTVHLFKCIRNNWLAQKDAEKTFCFPDSSDSENTLSLKASFSHLRKLYHHEKSSTVKLAPSLNQKSLYPTATEKQNVKLMLRVFDVRNVVALEHTEKLLFMNTYGTRQFINSVVKLWNIVNVKHPAKDLRLRNVDCRRLTSSTDESVQFIQKMVHWLHQWKEMNLRLREGTLSNETMTALEHTLRAMIELVSYLLEEKKYAYVLLGKFQTDNIESRFSLYRQMSGSNYHVSVQQLLEGEKKLKLMSVLKLISASKGSLSLKDITDPVDEVKHMNSVSAGEEYTSFLYLLPECDSVQLSPEQEKALVFVSGYAVSKVLPHLDCDICINSLRVEKSLQVEVTKDCYTYLSALDRGGLIWPTDLAVEMISQVFRIFQLLIGKEDSEQEFILCTKQSNVLMSLIVQRIQDLHLCDGQCEECSQNVARLIPKCCKPAINIFLNNYSKCFSDKTSSGSNARKLKTFA